MKKENSYYENELNKIKSCEHITFKFYGVDSETRNLNFNLESIKDLKKFINKMEKELIKSQVLQNDNKLKG